MAQILYGAPVREKMKRDLIEKVKKLGWKPCLAIVQVGDRPDSNIYIKNKVKFGQEIGVKVNLYKFAENIKEAGLIEEIKKLSTDENIDGIIVQLPLPKHIDSEKIINLISKNKDADGLVSRTFLDTILITPATARAVLALLDYYEISVKGKKVAMIGQSILAGRPISDELEKRGAEVARCDINTKNIPEIARECDILISAVGKAGLITKDFVNQKQVVVDVGINRTSPPNPNQITPLIPTESVHSLDFSSKNLNESCEAPSIRFSPLTLRGEPEKPKLVGDVDFAEVEPLVSAITPVPGSVGPLTVACLFENLLDLCQSKVL